MTKLYKYYNLFTLKFLVRIFFVKILRIFSTEVRQLEIADQILAQNALIRPSRRGLVTVGLPVNGRQIRVVLRKQTSDLLVFNQVILARAYEPLLVLIANYYRREVRVVVDVGANIGLTTLYLLSHFPNANFFSIEPSRMNLSVLRSNIETNNFHVNIFEMAILASAATVAIDNTFRDRQDWSTRVVRSDSTSGIRALSLTEFRSRHNLEVIDILKIDIEGHEAELFDSVEFLSELRTVRFLAVELHEEQADRVAIIIKLRDLGFLLTYRSETLFGYNPTVL